MFARLATPVILFVLVPVSACSSSDSAGQPPVDTGPAGDAQPTADGAPAGEGCAAYAAKLCDLFDACDPVYVDEVWGTRERCVASVEVWCQPTIGAAGSRATPAVWKACADALSLEKCNDLIVRPKPCVVLGELPNGAPCGIGPQCATGYCNGGLSRCGVCGDPPHNDSIYSDVGGPCGAGFGYTCSYGLRCVAGTCQTTVTEVGQSCADKLCSEEYGLSCDASKHCALTPRAHAGDPCDSSGSKATACTDFTRCKSGTCVPLPELGAACTTGDICPSYTGCTDAGKCGVVDPASCK